MTYSKADVERSVKARLNSQPLEGGSAILLAMTIEPPLRSRLPYLVFGFGMAAAMPVLAVIAVVVQSANPVLMAVIALGGMALFAGLGWGAGGPSTLQVDEGVLRYASALSKPKVIPRADLAGIVRVPGSRGLYAIEIRGHDGKALISTGASFKRADMQSLAAALSVPLTWDGA